MCSVSISLHHIFSLAANASKFGNLLEEIFQRLNPVTIDFPSWIVPFPGFLLELSGNGAL